MMKKILISGLLTFVLVQPILGMEEDRKNADTNEIIPEQKELNKQLLDAASKGDLSLVKLLLNQGAIIGDVRYTHRWKDILMKSYHDNNELLKLVVKGETSLVKAIKMGDVVGVEQLINDGADVNEPDGSVLQFSPLFWACTNGSLQIVQRLLACKDIQINIIDKKGLTPLHHACNKGLIDVIKLLLAHKDIQVNMSYDPHSNLHTPLNTLLMSSRNDNGIDILKLFLAHKDIELEAKAKGEPNSLHLACLGGSSEKVMLILKSLIKPAISWQQARLVLIGHQQEDCDFANLPMEIIQHIFSFCGDKRKNIQKLRSFICAKANKKTPFGCAQESVKKKLGYILDPDAWKDDETAEKTYAQLLTLLKEDDLKKKEEDYSKKRKSHEELEPETKKVKKERLENNGKQEE